MALIKPIRATALTRSRLLCAAWAPLAAALIGAVPGCMPPPPPPPATQPSMPSPDRVAALRATYQQQAPGTLVGQVDAVLPQSLMASVGDVPVQEFKEGDTITFIDIDSNIINHGHVSNITGDHVIVKYDSDGTRPPRKGDLAVRLK